MNYLSVDFYKAFECIADACPNNCCSDGWAIGVEEETYKSMIANEKALGISSKDFIIANDGSFIIKLDNGQCPLLNENGLCKAVLTLGPSYISETCKLYPRIHLQYGNVIENSLSLSCPDVVCKLMEQSRVSYDYYEDEISAPPYSYTALYSYESAVRQSITDLFYLSSDISISVRLYASYNIFDKAVSLYNNGITDFNQLKKEISLYYQSDALSALDKRLKNIINENSRYKFLQQLHVVIVPFTHDGRFVKLIEQINEYFNQNDLEKYLTDVEAFKLYCHAYHNFYLNYWVYRLFTEAIAIPDYECVKDRLIYIAAEFCLIQTLALVSYSHTGKLDKDEYVYIVSSIAKLTEHNSVFRESLSTQLTQNNLIGIAGLLLLTIL